MSTPDMIKHGLWIRGYLCNSHILILFYGTRPNWTAVWFFFESSVDIILGDFLIPKSPFSRAGHAGWPNVPWEPEKTVPGTNEGREKEGGWEARMRKPGMGDKVGADQVVGGRLGEALDGLSC